MENILNNTESNTAEISNLNEELVQVTPIEETPFACLKYDNNYYLVLGKYRLTQAMETKEAVEIASTDASWHRIMQICGIMVAESEDIENIKNEIQELKNKLENN